MENGEAVERDKQQAEVFDALGHPTRIAILKALSEGSLGFADLKKKTGIQSSGHLQHHINKLDSLVKTDAYGKYCLSDEGKDALLTIGTVEDAANPSRKPNSKWRVSSKKFAAALLICIIASTLITAWTYDRINTHEKWAAEFREAQNFRNYLDEHDIDNAYSSIGELVRLDRAHSSELGMVDSFLCSLHDPDLNLSRLSPTNQTAVGRAMNELGDKVLDAYGSILNYTRINYVSGPPFWYFGPPSPDETLLKEAADIAANAEAIIK